MLDLNSVLFDPIAIKKLGQKFVQTLYSKEAFIYDSEAAY